MYNAVVGKIYCSPHPNADRIKIGHIHGFRVIVSLDAQDGDLYAYFDCDGQLSEEYAKANDLVRRKNPDGTHAGGFFEENRRVRAQPFRGVKSEGFAMPLSSFAFTGYDISSLKEGDQFFELNGVPICNKYYTKATLSKMNKQTEIKENLLKKAFPQHYDTAQFRYATLQKGDLITITEKEHGTSVRYGYVAVETKKNFFWRILRHLGFEYYEGSLIFSLGGKPWVTLPKNQYVLGTRRAILPKKSEFSFIGGYYGEGEPYNLAAKKLYGKLKLKEIVYGELVGYTSNGHALFTHGLAKLPDLKKQYADPMEYSYGCIKGEARFRVYRIVQDGRDLSPYEVVARARELGVETVTEIDKFVFDGNRDRLNAYIETLLEGPSLIDSRHMREGVCIRVDNEFGHKVYKEKSYSFKLAEGIVKENENYVDAEEIA